jgi:RNA polymerase sigma factor (sigma-70 family)
MQPPMNHLQRPDDIHSGNPTDLTVTRGADSQLNKIEIGLIKAISRGDKSAMTKFYDIYYPRLHRFLYRIIRDPESIMELINDVMLIVWQKADIFREHSLVSTWVFAIAYNRALDRIRKDKRYREVLIDAADSEPVDSALNEVTMIRDLNVIMNVLTPEQRAVVELTFDFGYSYPEIAEILDVPVNTVKTRMFYARKLMQTEFSQGTKK